MRLQPDVGSKVLRGGPARPANSVQGRGAQAFRDTVDDCRDWCVERGEEPELPFKGNTLVRTAPELHRKAAVRAAAEGVSLNEWISRRIAEAA